MSEEFQAKVMEKLNAISTDIALIKSDIKHLPTLTERVDKLESWRDRILGGGFVLTSLAGLAEYLFHRGR
jgi:hypothetical protein